MWRVRGIDVGVLCLWLMLASVPVAVFGESRSEPPFGEDVVLAWNLVMLDANAADHALSSPDQGGPTRTSRAFAIVSAAMFDAWNTVHRKYQPYLSQPTGYGNADMQAAVSSAAYETLKALYPQQRTRFEATFANWLRKIPAGTWRNQGVRLGRKVAEAILAARRNDFSNSPMVYTPLPTIGFHQPDPLHPDQGFHAPQWGYVTPFVIRSAQTFLSPPPPRLASPRYTQAYRQVQLLGGDGLHTPTLRTREQTNIGLYWSYDGTPRIGTPPRLYNQIVRVIARNRRNTVEQNARLFALVNLAMADAGIQCWRTKYIYQFWRPVIAIRNGDLDGNAGTDGDTDWTPLGALATNGGGDGVNFTPPFPAYTSGHATFGAASMWSIAKFYGTAQIPFTFTSDELNGINVDGDGSPRPVVTRSFRNLHLAIEENAVSRIYLGIHWQFDADEGVYAGKAIAEEVYARALRPVVRQ